MKKYEFDISDFVLNCPKCQSYRWYKKGKRHDDPRKHRYECRDCGVSYSDDYKNRIHGQDAGVALLHMFKGNIIIRKAFSSGWKVHSNGQIVRVDIRYNKVINEYEDGLPSQQDLEAKDWILL